MCLLERLGFPLTKFLKRNMVNGKHTSLREHVIAANLKKGQYAANLLFRLAALKPSC